MALSLVIVASQAYFSQSGGEETIVYSYPPNATLQSNVNTSNMVEFSRIFESPVELLNRTFKVRAEVETSGNQTLLVSEENEIIAEGCDLEDGGKPILSVNLTRDISCDCEYKDPRDGWVNITSKILDRKKCRNQPPDLFSRGRCINNTEIASYRLQCIEKIDDPYTGVPSS